MKAYMINILSCDPGSKNFGWSVLSGKLENGRITFKIKANGMCPCPVSQVKGSKALQEDCAAFQDWFESIVTEYNIDAVCAERFMARGLLGALGEYVGIMMGIMIASLRRLGNKPMKIFPAATWKNAVKRNTNDKEFLTQMYKDACVVPHQLDAALIGVWTLYQGFNRKDFGDIDLRERKEQLLSQVEATSKEKLITRKVKRQQ